MNKSYESIAKKIVALKDKDLRLRDKLIEEGKLSDGYNQNMETLHIANAQALEKIITEIGFPSISKVGKEASEAAWLIIQHAISLPNFMKKCAELLRESVERGDGNVINLAYLTDRIAVYEGRLQFYGTQFDWNEDGQLVAQPYDELDLVNQRRAAVGLNTLEEQTKIIEKRAREERQSRPADFERRKIEYDKWRNKVGWI